MRSAGYYFPAPIAAIDRLLPGRTTPRDLVPPHPIPPIYIYVIIYSYIYIYIYIYVYMYIREPNGSCLYPHLHQSPPIQVRPGHKPARARLSQSRPGHKPVKARLSESRRRHKSVEARTYSALRCMPPLPPADTCSSRFQNNYFAEMSSGSGEGSHLRLMDFCITQLWARK